ncbi:MAG: DMT family transporter [Parvibaculaceae bacterium]
MDRSITRAAFWMAGWLAALLTITVAGRELASELPVFMIMLFRSVIALAFLIPIVLWLDGEPLRTRRLGGHLVRNFVHYSAQFCWFYALSLIPLARVVAIEFTMPIWTAILAALFLAERLSPSRIAAIVLGFIGILMIVRPGIEQIGTGEFSAFYAALAFAVAMILTKSLTHTESALTVIVYMFIIQALIGLLPALSVWTWPSPAAWPWVIVLGVAGGLSHYCLARAFAAAEATVVVPMDFLRVPLTALLGWLLYAEKIDIWLALGAGLILSGNLLNLRQEGGKAPAAAVRSLPARKPAEE